MSNALHQLRLLRLRGHGTRIDALRWLRATRLSSVPVQRLPVTVPLTSESRAALIHDYTAAVGLMLQPESRDAGVEANTLQLEMLEAVPPIEGPAPGRLEVQPTMYAALLTLQWRLRLRRCCSWSWPYTAVCQQQQLSVRRARWLQWGSDAVLAHAVRAMAALTAAAAAARNGDAASAGAQQLLSGSAAAVVLLQGRAHSSCFQSATVAHADIRAAAARRAAASAQVHAAAGSADSLVTVRLAGRGAGRWCIWCCQ